MQQYQRPFGRKFLFDPKCGESFTSAASHDKLTSLAFWKFSATWRSPQAGVGEAWAVPCTCHFSVIVAWGYSISNVQSRKQELTTVLSWLHRLNGFLPIRSVVAINRRLSIALAVGLTEEFVYIMFGNVMIRGIALSLYSQFSPFLCLKQDQCRNRHPALRVFLPQPDLINLSWPFGSFLRTLGKAFKLLARFKGHRQAW